MKTQLTNSTTRFLALSAIALTLSAVPSRAQGNAPQRGASQTLRTTNSADDYANGSGPNAVTLSSQYDGPRSAPSANVQFNRGRSRRGDRDDRWDRNRRDRQNTYIGGFSAAPVSPGYSVPGYVFPGYSYNVPAYPYGFDGFGGFGGGGVIAPGATVVVPQGPYSVPIGPSPYPWFSPPTITSAPLGGTTIINGRGRGRGRYYPQSTQTYTYGYPQQYYAGGTIDQSYSGLGLGISRAAVNATVLRSRTSTSSQTTLNGF